MTRLLCGLAWLLAPVDRRLQRVFDAIFVFLMREGIPRKRIRYTIWGSFAVFYVISLYTYFADKYLAVLGVVFGGLHLWTYGRKMQFELELDEMAEKHGMPSIADNDFARSSAKLMGCIFLVLSIGTPLMLARGEYPKFWMNDLGRFLCAWSALAGGYLCRTPPTQPRQKERQTRPLFGQMVAD